MKTFTFIAGLSFLSFAAIAADEIVFNCDSLDGWQKTGDWAAAGAVSLNKTNDHLFVIEPGKGIIVNGPVGKTV
jgi:hypothetical protein